MEDQKPTTSDADNESPGITLIRAHPTRLEAVTALEGGSLARWTLEDPPRLLAHLQTDYNRIGQLAVSPDGTQFAVCGGRRAGGVIGTIEFRSWEDLSGSADLPVRILSCLVSLLLCGRTPARYQHRLERLSDRYRDRRKPCRDRDRGRQQPSLRSTPSPPGDRRI